MSSLRCKQKPSTAFAARSIPNAPHCFFANLPIQYLLSFEEMLLPILSTRGDPCAAEEALGFSYDPYLHLMHIQTGRFLLLLLLLLLKSTFVLS